MSGWHVAVVIPAHNEQDTIVECLRSVLVAAACAPRLANLRIVVAADACSDLTAGRAREVLADQGEVIELDARSAGEARRRGTQLALQHFDTVPRDRIWVACTDADSSVNADWLQVQLTAADQGLQGLAGIVRLAGGSSRLQQVYERSYRIRADGSHDHVHGANLAFRADAYLHAGGWSDLALSEDHCLWRRLKSLGYRLQASASSVVHTSARLEGRVEGGFASTMRARLQQDLLGAGAGA